MGKKARKKLNPRSYRQIVIDQIRTYRRMMREIISWKIDYGNKHHALYTLYYPSVARECLANAINTLHYERHKRLKEILVRELEKHE